MDKSTITKDIIKKAAAKLFQKYGFQKTSMDDIAELSHKAKRSIYYHFSNKDSLYAAVINDEINHLKTALNPIINQPGELAPVKCAKYLYTRMEIMNKLYTYHQLIKDDFVNKFDLSSKGLLFDITNRLSKWESEQLTYIIKKGQENREILDNIDSKAFIDMLLMIIKSLEILFFVNKEYDYYAPTFNSLLINVIQALSPDSQELIKNLNISKYNYIKINK